MTAGYVILAVVAALAAAGVGFLVKDIKRIALYWRLKEGQQPGRLEALEAVAVRNTLPAPLFSKGVMDLAAFVRAEKPDWLIGVHTGGRLLTSFVASEVGFETERCVFAHTEATRATSFRITRANQLTGKLLFVDDITRTGSTLRALNRYVMQRVILGEYDINDAKYAVMVVVEYGGPSAESELVFDPHWARFSSRHRFLKLPWSTLSERVKHEYENKFRGLSFDAKYLDLHERIVADFKFSLWCAQLALAEGDKFERLVKEGNLTDAYEGRVLAR